MVQSVSVSLVPCSTAFLPERRTYIFKRLRCSDIRYTPVELRQRVEGIAREEDGRGRVGELKDEGLGDLEISEESVSSHRGRCISNVNLQQG
jgi:hypothetical protein